MSAKDGKMKISELTSGYDLALADLIRFNLKKHHLDIPGTVYFDDNLAAAIHVYEKCGYKEIEKPVGVVHATMNRFFIKEL